MRVRSIGLPITVFCCKACALQLLQSTHVLEEMELTPHAAAIVTHENDLPPLSNGE